MPEESPVLKVEIDRGRCEGHNRCVDRAPTLFGSDDEGQGYVLGDGTVAPEDEAAARSAVDNCPERAIKIVVASTQG